MNVPDAIFYDYVARYVHIITRIRYKHLVALQPPPHANLAHGGGGTAYALHRIAEVRGDARLVRLARVWVADALADRRRARFPTSSYLFGRSGLHALRARIDPAARDHSIAAYLRVCRSARTGPLELMSGRAGQLVGACAMLRGFDDTRLRRFAAVRAHDLLDHVQRRASRPWREADASNLAHGWPGVLYAVAAWHELSRLAPPPWLISALVRLARAWREHAVPRHDMRASWCTGAAGATLLWCKTFAITGESELLRTARRTGDAARRHLDVTRQHLCCGIGGVAHALLALETIDPGRAWRAHARQIGAGAMTDAAPSRWPSGLLWGHPGLACLALDLVAKVPQAFPSL